MKKMQYSKGRWAAIMAAVVLIVCPLKAAAIESVVLPVEMKKEDVISIVLPTVTEEEKSPFDFILDPQGLLYETNAARYGGGVVEEGATLLFKNKEGEYDFSRYSDQLAVTNRSTVPALLTISVWVTDLGELHMVDSDDFTDSDDCSVYLAVVDDQGNEHPILADGEVTIQAEMKAAPENTYVYKLSDDLRFYQPVQSPDFEEIDFDTYFVGLVGACNPNAYWGKHTSVHPVVTVTWRVEPIIEEEPPVNEGYTVPNGIESVSGNEPFPGDETDIEEGTFPGDETDMEDGMLPEDETDMEDGAVPKDETDMEDGMASEDETDIEDDMVAENESNIEDETAAENEATIEYEPVEE